MCSLSCLCLDLHVSVYIYVPLLRSMCLCASCHACVLGSMLVAMPCAPFDISLSCFLVLPVGCRYSSHGLGLHPHTYTYIKGFGSITLHVYVCLLASMIYLHISLSRSKFYHSLCPLWACACVVTSILPRVCLDVTTCEIHPRGVGVLDSRLSPLREMLICLPCLLCATRLAFFASLHLCMLAYMFMHETVCHPYSNPMELRILDQNLHLSS